MFGHDDDHKNQDDVQTINPTVDTTDSGSPSDDPSVAVDSTAVTDDETPSVSAPTTPDDTVESVTDTVVDTPTETTETTEEVTTEDVPSDFGAPEVVTTDDTETTTVSDEPVVTTDESSTPTDDASTDSTPPVAAEPVVATETEEVTTIGTPSLGSFGGDGHDDLLNLKKTALEELAPLVDQLDQSPEEKFKTTMMMIQATDAADLVKVAHDAAAQITDDKARAQALLDIVNEINYFTQKDS